MWKTVLPDYNSAWEPLELRCLKRQLANLNCKCKTCDKSMELVAYRPLEEQKDREIQAVVSKCYLDSFAQATIQLQETSKPSYLSDQIRDNILCPTCYVTLNLLRAGMARVFKDEEIETKAEMFSCDKSTEKCVNSLEKTTSLTIRPALKYSNYSFNDYYISDKTSLSTCTSPPRKSSHREVSFLLDAQNTTTEDIEPVHSSFDDLVGKCICLDKYIDSIRPPWETY